MGQGDNYSIAEFANRLAKTEEKYGREIHELILCFINSRVDLPVKKLEGLSKARMKCAKHLNKIDDKKEEYINLWKFCNIYSATAVDVDDAMREIRNSIRKRLKTKERRDTSAHGRLIDEYRPSKKADHQHQQEIYDKPTKKEKQRWRDLTLFGRKKEKELDNSFATLAHVPKSAPPLPDPKAKPHPLVAERRPNSLPNGISHSPKEQTQSDHHSAPIPPPSTLKPGWMRAPAPLPPAHEKSSLTSASVEDAAGSESKQKHSSIPPRPDDVKRQDIGSTEAKDAGSGSNTSKETPTAPRQISPTTLYKPTAPHSHSVSKTKMLSVDTGGEDLEDNALERNCVFQLSHTTIAILPSPQSPRVPPTLMQIEDSRGEENPMLERRGGTAGVLAKRHSIKINNNSTIESDAASFSLCMQSPGTLW
ncbi:unnamed protein product [Cylicocyclus nassatus]|uniref:Uncharacterized protein n=1 Tax=Cylicocyclus nassatus TaxID=53992 RepID=A0AA36H8S4_CYLNA|nr:unnamed protein product [Cylicocyclus nassatus]